MGADHFGSVGLGILLTSVYLLIGRKWAWWVAIILRSILVLVGCITLVAFLNPRDGYARMEGGFGFFLGALFLLPGVILLVLLLFPPVRQRFSLGARFTTLSADSR